MSCWEPQSKAATPVVPDVTAVAVGVDEVAVLLLLLEVVVVVGLDELSTLASGFKFCVYLLACCTLTLAIAPGIRTLARR